MALEGSAEWNTSALLVHRQFSVLGAVGQRSHQGCSVGLGYQEGILPDPFCGDEVCGKTGCEAGPALLAPVYSLGFLVSFSSAGP